jgi:hypothetical protein
MTINLSLTQCFGENALQDESVLIIKKSDLSLLPEENNTAEELVSAILLKIVTNFHSTISTESNEILTTETGSGLTYDHRTDNDVWQLFVWRNRLVTRNSQRYKQLGIVYLGKLPV